MRLLLALVLLVSVAIAYPWAAVILGLCALSVLLVRSAARQPAPPVRQPSTAETAYAKDHRRAHRSAWGEMHAIERAHGLPLTPRVTRRVVRHEVHRTERRAVRRFLRWL